MLELDLNIKQAIAAAEKALTHIKGGFNQAVSRSLNRTLDSMKTRAARETSRRYYINVSEIKKSFAF